MTRTKPALLSELETEKAIASLKQKFANTLSKKLNLIKVEAPLIVEKGTGINDDLNGIEHPVKVHAKGLAGTPVEIVHSLAKWKRARLAKLGMKPGEGLYTDMRALRPDEDLSDVHSVYVDQWDWEKVILPVNRSLQYLERIVMEIYSAIQETELHVTMAHPKLKAFLPKEITFIHTEELQRRYPDLSPKQRESEIAKSKGAVFIIGIGGKLADGQVHDGRAPDYDDWISETGAATKGLNGDIVVWNPVLKRAFEISSMGIRVSPDSLRKQLQISGQEERLELKWHKQLLEGKLPQTIGGGIGQSRLAMLLLQKKHIGEVQSGIWPQEVIETLTEQEIILLS
ncbi:MAG: aspartate--ammonia ligase [Bacteroidia bacterium]